MLFTTLFVECGSINQSEPAEPAAIPTVTGLPDQPEEIDNDIPDAYPAPAPEDQQEIEAQSYPAPAPEDQPEIESQSYPAPTQQNRPDPYPSEPQLPTPYPDPES